MFNFLKFLILLVFTKHVYSDESLTFSSEKQFFDFLEQWRQSTSVDGFRRYHSNFAKQLMNVSANPCEDFYNFACGNFESVLPQDAASNYRQTTDINFFFSGNIFDKEILSDVTGEESEIVLKAKNFYKSCLNDDAWVPEVGGNFLKNFGKWPLLNDDWSESDFDWLNVSAHVAYYAQHELIRHLTGYNDLLIDGFVPVWASQVDLADLKNTFKAFSINLDGKEDQLEDVLQLNEALRNLTNDYTAIGEQKLFTIRELEEQYPKFEALRFLKIVYDRDDLSPDMPVFVRGTNYFRRLNELVASTDSKTIANFILSQLALNLVPKRDDYFLSGRKGSCLRYAKSAFYFGLVSWFEDTYISKESRQKIDTFRKTLQDIAYTYFGDRKVDKERIHNMENHVFFPLTTNVSDFFIPIEMNVTVDPNNFYSTWLQLKRVFKLKSMNGFEPDLFYRGEYTSLPTRDGLVVPLTLFIPPFFHEHAPEYFKYGALGSYLSHQFYKVFSEDRETFRNSLSCLKSVGYEKPDNYTCAATEGVSLALTAYKNWLSRGDSNPETTDIEFNGRLLDGEQGLLLSHAQSVCVKRDEFTKEKISQAFSKFSELRRAYNCD